MKPDVILQMLSNAEFLVTDKALVRPLSIVNIHVILKFCLGKELHGTDLAVKRHNCSILLTSVCLDVNLVAFCLCECLKAVVTAVKGSACFHRLNCSDRINNNILVNTTELKGMKINRLGSSLQF